jgi:hypothetical protein
VHGFQSEYPEVLFGTITTPFPLNHIQNQIWLSDERGAGSSEDRRELYAATGSWGSHLTSSAGLGHAGLSALCQGLA